MDFGELKNDKVVQEKLLGFEGSISKIDKILEIAFSDGVVANLTVKDKLNYDLFIAYTLNTLYYLYLRSNGIDANGTDVKKELTRVKEYMMKAKVAIERHTDRGKLDQPAAARFIKHGLGLSIREKTEEAEGDEGSDKTDDEPANKKRKTT